MLRKIRVTLEVVMLIGVTLLLLDFTGVTARWLGWMARVQLLPAILAANVAVIAALVVVTLLLGRIYCSVICPLGALQDVVSHLHGRRKKNRFGYSPAKRWLRYAMLVVMVASLVAGVGAIVALLAPYGTYGRFVSSVLQPLYLLANNGLAALAEHYESYAFYSREVWLRSLPTLIVAVVMTSLIAVLAWRGGRTWCNTVCPVGTLLSFVSRFSLMKVRLDADKCRSCGLCSRNCKASCIDFKNRRVDYTRCVTCGDCLTKCNFGALTYGPTWGKKKAKAAEPEPEKHAAAKPREGSTRRAFLVGATIVGAEVAMGQMQQKMEGGLAPLKPKQLPTRRTIVTPPGSVSAAHMVRHCVECQLCVDKCPNGVLRPSSDLEHLMMPVMSFENGFCRPECTRCSQVCPAGAIRPIDKLQKSATQIGHAVWRKKLCVIVTDHVECGNCARHCPVQAIMMVPLDPTDDLSPMVPAVDESRCLGCGSCEYVCPAHPESAIYVEGHEVHRTI